MTNLRTICYNSNNKDIHKAIKFERTVIVMDMAIIFMIVATIAPFLYIHMKKYIWAVVQGILLIGMWIYFAQSLNPATTPANFSIQWFAFYLCLVISEIAYVMFAIYLAKKIQLELREKATEKDDQPVSDL